MNEFTFVARVVSVLSAFNPVVIRFSPCGEFSGEVNFDPRFFLMTPKGSELFQIPVIIYRAWIMPLGIFLFLYSSSTGSLQTLFVSNLNPQSALLRACLNCLNSDDLLEKPTYSIYFWRMNVLR